MQCDVDIEKTASSFHAHAVPDGIAIRPGDSRGRARRADRHRLRPAAHLPVPATVTRAGPVARWWTGFTAMFELTELYEVGFLPKETP